MKDEIASTELRCIARDGRGFDAHVSIGRPYLAVTGEWRCPLSLGALDEGIPDMAGEDALQALCMALSTARALLEHFVQQGGRLSYLGGDSVFNVQTTFGRVGKGT